MFADAALPREARHILLVRLRSIGDAVLMTPLAEAIRIGRPEARLAVLLEAPAASLFDAPDPFHQVWVAERGLSGRLRTLARIRRARFDVVLDLHGGPTAAWLTALSGAGRRIGLAAFRSRWAYDRRLPSPFKGKDRSETLHTVESNLLVARELGLEPPAGLRPRLTVSAAGRAEAGRALGAAGLGPGSEFVALHPGAVLASKTWPEERFEEVARGLIAGGIAVAVIAPGAQAVSWPPQPGLHLLHRLTLPGLLAVLGRARALVGNDSGPAHMAAAVGVPTVTVFGSQDPRVWRPFGKRHRVLWRGLACSPCDGRTCTNPSRFECLGSIGANEVLEATRGVLSGG